MLPDRMLNSSLRLQLTNVYADDDKGDVIGPEGMEKFCEDIGVEPENVCWSFCAFQYNEYCSV